MTTREEDFIDHVFIASTHSYLLIFTNRGQVYWLKVYHIPDVGAAGRGKAIVNLVNMAKDEKFADIVTVKNFDPDRHVVMATRNGIVKKTALTEYSNPRSSGIIAINVPAGDELIGCQLTDGSFDVLLATRLGKAIRFSEKDVRDMGRTARGVIGIRLAKGDIVVGMSAFRGDGHFLTVTERGFGKRTSVDEYPRHGRGGSGVINVKVGEKNGTVVNTLYVPEQTSVMLITAQGKLIQLKVEDIRNTQTRAAVGVKCIDLDEGDYVASVAVVAAEESEGEAQES
jgi:DNA gyrase subunit A